jgi:mRNA-degrading endonuclease toxin of MazEF toxin-antitoxin module
MYKIKLNKIWNLIDKIKDDINLPIISDFLEWFLQKLEINFIKKTPNIIVNIWDIYDTELWINIWSELNKKRPCVIVSKSNFNKWNTIIIVPIRSIKNNTRLWSISFEIDINWTWLIKKSYLTPINIKEISKKRLLNRIWKLNINDINKLKNVLTKIFDIEKPPLKQ